MENQNTSLESKTKNITLESLVSWTVGIVFAISGFAMLFTKFVPGIFILLSAVLLLKPVRLFVLKKIHVSPSRNIKIGLVIVFLVIAGATIPTPEEPAIIIQNTNQKVPVAQTSAKTNTTPSLSKTDAEKELTEVMDLAKKAKLVSSYEFSDKAAVVYIDSVWYTQKVDFKKDFLAKVATLKKAITGYNHFEVRDAYSDEKVAEVTAFTNSLEVYK